MCSKNSGDRSKWRQLDRVTLGQKGFQNAPARRWSYVMRPALPSSISKPARVGRSSKYGVPSCLRGWDPELSFQAELCPSRLRFDSIGGSAAGEIESKASGKAARRGNDKLDHGY